MKHVDFFFFFPQTLAILILNNECGLFFSVQKSLLMIAIGLNLQVWIPRSISEPALKAFILLKDEVATSAAGFSSA